MIGFQLLGGGELKVMTCRPTTTAKNPGTHDRHI
jgi:hypothetical protein